MKYLIKLFYIILAIATISCSSRKVAIQKEDIQIEQVAKADEQVSIISESNETIIDTSFCYEEEFEPVDSSKPFMVNGKVYQNVKFKSKKTKNNIYTSKKEDSSLNQRKTTLNKTSIDIKTKDKETERKTLLPWWWWILILITLSGYLIYRRYKVL